MSYILNALRKSERERQAIEPDSVTNRIVIHQPQPAKSSAKLVAVLVVINVAILVYFLGFAPEAPPIPPQAIAPATAPLPAEKTTPVAAVESKPASKTLPKAEIARAAVPTLLPTPSPIKKQPVKDTKPSASPAPNEAVKAATASPASEIEPNSESVIVTLAPPQAEIRPIEPPPAAAEIPLPPPKQDDGLPFQEDLPIVISRSLPNLTINVFSYSAVPSERFVMIDMVKYVPGQQIKDQLELKEIRENCIVVGYDGHIFKIRRP